MSFIFTSESVGEGHPDKVCDQISDAVLDAALAQDPTSRVAIETFTTTGIVIVGGEMTTNATLDVQDIVRKTLRNIGYSDSAYGIHADYCSVMIAIHEQSVDIAQGVNEGEGLYDKMGAGDQGLMFGYACKQTPEYMPLPIQLSHQIMQQLSSLRKEKKYNYLRPDAKAQVSVEYTDRNTPKRIDTVVLSTQHDPDVDYDMLKANMIDVIKSVIPAHLLDEDTRYLINPTGRFVIGGPHGDAGLTGRKIIVDTYGGWVPHGGGAFSGKDSTKVDRSAAYMARYVAKNMVAAGLADELEIQLAYAIGFPEPVSVHVNHFNSSKLSTDDLIKIIRKEFDLTPAGIIKTLRLREPVFAQTAAYGHFGRTDIDLPWEALDKVPNLISQVSSRA
ncbi:MAG: methionine adenosyltransferase [Rickettsiales bacterium]|nr:methionine adenosyltransferase [Rickettsiales bacterium]|tara:strand:- start:495 stop:1661 length:1167 start_codon:yes stop_codon:yes gene_type:complete